jgi:hypothetical protein
MNTIEHIERGGLSVAERLPEKVDREQVTRYGVRDRLTARLRAGALDRVLASGALQNASPALALRARALAGPALAEECAAALRRIIQEARRSRPIPGMRVIGGARERVLGAEHELRGLASLLQSGQPLNVRGIAKVRMLLTDGTGPLFYRDSDQSLSDAVRDAASALGHATASSAR